MPTTKKKKSWKERQRTRQAKQQSAKRINQAQLGKDSATKSGKSRKSIAVVLMVVLVSAAVGGYAVFHYLSTPSTPETFTIIRIKADGAVDPANASISTLGNNQYVFKSDIYGSIAVERDNIVLDGNKHTLRGAGSSSSIGIDLRGRTNVTVKDISLREFSCGFFLNSASSNNITRNSVTNTTSGIEMTLASNNTVNGNSINGCGGAIGLSESSGNSITGNSLEGNQYSLSLTNSSLNTISGNVITKSSGAIGFSKSSNNSISGNSLNSNSICMLMDNSAGNNVYSNTIANNNEAIRLSQSTGNRLAQNTLISNQYGIGLNNSISNTIYGNTITNSTYAIALAQSFGNTVSSNTLESNQRGVYLTFAYSNVFVQNRFRFNQQQVFSSSSENTWDGGYTSGGNYWSDYLYLYPDAKEIDQTGMWDTPYVIDENNMDTYPLVSG